MKRFLWILFRDTNSVCFVLFVCIVRVHHVSYVCFYNQETEKLEDEKADLQKEIETLQKEKDKLEFMLVAHNPVCKLPPEERHPSSLPERCTPLPLPMRPSLGSRSAFSSNSPIVVKQEPLEDDDEGSQAKCQRSVIKPICLGGGMYCMDGDSLNTPVVAASTPVSTPGNPSLIFTYPNMLEPDSPSPSSESCSKAHRRSSSSGDQSSDSLNSPTLLALWGISSHVYQPFQKKHCQWVPDSGTDRMSITPRNPQGLNVLLLFEHHRREFNCEKDFSNITTWAGPRLVWEEFITYKCLNSSRQRVQKP